MDDFDEEDNIFDSDDALEVIFLDEDANDDKVQDRKAGCLGLVAMIIVPAFLFAAIPSALQYML